mgnify:CR=1 FL=1
MAELTNEQKKAWAKTLYTRETLTQAEIAERVGVSRVTVNNWIGKGNWEQLKASITITREEQLKNLYRQLAELKKAGRGTVPERRGSGHHFQTVERHQETGNRSGAGGHHLRVLRPAQMGADLRFHAGEGDHPASGRVCQIKIILTWQRKDSHPRTGSHWTTGTSWWHPCANIRTSTPRTRKRKSGRGGKDWRRTTRSGSNTTSPCIAPASPPPSTKKPPGG